MRLFIVALMLCIFAPDAALAATAGQQLRMESYLDYMVKEQQDELQGQKDRLLIEQKRENEDAAVATKKLEAALKMAQYWARRGQNLERFAQLQEEKKAQTAADVARKERHLNQLAAMRARIDQQNLDLQAAQTRYRAAMLLDRTNDYDSALGYAMAAYGNPDWSPRQPRSTSCRTRYTPGAGHHLAVTIICGSTTGFINR